VAANSNTRTNTPTQVPALPAIPAGASPELRKYLETLSQVVSIRLGRRGDPRDRAVTLRELIDGGLAKEFSSSPFDPNRTGNTGFTSPSTSLADLAVPPAPTGFTANGAYSQINLNWDYPAYSNHSHTEVHVHTSDVIGDATLLGIQTGRVFVDPVGSGQTRYYWVRHVNTAGVAGTFNSASGTVAATATDVAHQLGILAGAVTTSELASSLSTPIAKIDPLATFTGYSSSYTGSSLLSRIGSAETGITNLNSTFGSTTAAAASATAAAQSESAAIAAKADALLAQAAAETAQSNAETAETAAETAQAAAETSQTAASASATGAAGSASTASQEAATAANSATAAGNSASAAATSATNAATFATAAGSSATASQNSRLAAETAESNAETAESGAASSASAAATSATAASASQSAAASSASAANSDRIAAQTARSGAESAETSAVSAKNDAESAEANAATSETNAANSATSAGNSATAANTSASNAATSATAAGTASSAATTARTAAQSARDTAQTAKAGAEQAETDAVAAKNAAQSSASAAATSAQTASTQATAAGTAATAASTSATNAASSAGSASTFSQNASTSATTAAGHAASAAQNFNSITARLDSIGGSGVTVEQKFTAVANDVSGLEGQYTVKIDSNGAVAGFGLASSTTAAGGITSEFIVNADRFAIMRGGSNTATATVPFVVQASATTLNGESVPAGVYMADAFIKNGSIASAKIGELHGDKITAGTITSDRISSNRIEASKLQIDTNVLAEASNGDLILATGSATKGVKFENLSNDAVGVIAQVLQSGNKTLPNNAYAYDVYFYSTPWSEYSYTAIDYESGFSYSETETLPELGVQLNVPSSSLQETGNYYIDFGAQPFGSVPNNSTTSASMLVMIAYQKQPSASTYSYYASRVSNRVENGSLPGTYRTGTAQLTLNKNKDYRFKLFGYIKGFGSADSTSGNHGMYGGFIRVIRIHKST
jgi:hypothetical protein